MRARLILGLVFLLSVSAIALQHREEWRPAANQIDAARQAGVELLIEIDLGDGVPMKMILIPAGAFVMGSPALEEGRHDGEARHEVTISEPFYIGVHEVTRGQFSRFVAETKYKTDAEKDGWAHAWVGWTWSRVNGASWKAPGFTQDYTHPVTDVSWNDAVVFCEWLSQKVEGTVRLPTEAEWEYACRAGTATPFNTGATITTDEANYKPNFMYGSGRKPRYRKKTMSVGSFKPNAWGLYDMHGNVWEWCSDWYGDYPRRNVTDPGGPATGTLRVVRGGPWYLSAWQCRSAHRIAHFPRTCRGNGLGFRCVRTAVTP